MNKNATRKLWGNFKEPLIIRATGSTYLPCCIQFVPATNFPIA